MTSVCKTTVTELTEEITLQAGGDPLCPPRLLDPRAAAEALGVKPGTLAIWRSTGRYNLPYVKVGRLVRYRLTDIAKFMLNHTARHTGEGSDNA